MNNEIMKGETTNIFAKIWNGIIKVIKGFWNWLTDTESGFIVCAFTILIGAVFGFFTLIKHLEEKNYPYGNYEMTYRVYYTTSHVKEYTINHNRPIEVYSSKGSNVVKKYNGERVIETSAPIEVVRYVKYK
jgi:hypothetical protein